MKWKKITLVDTALLEANAAPEAPTPAEPGATLPADFPREEFTTEQLILLEELAFQYTREFILRFFRILATPLGREGQKVTSNICNVACQAIVLSKLLGLNAETSWRDIAQAFGISKTTVHAAKDTALARLDRLATRGTRSADDWAALAALARRQARLYSLKAAGLREPLPGVRKKPAAKKPELGRTLPPDFRAGN